MRSVAHHVFSDERGASLVETAVVVPFLLLLGLGVSEFGNVLYNHHLIETGVRDAARYLARFGTPATRETEAKALAVTGSISGGTQRISWWNTGDVSISYQTTANPSGAYRGPDPILVVRVSTTVTYNGLGFLDFLGLGSSLTFSLAHEQRVIGD